MSAKCWFRQIWYRCFSLHVDSSFFTYCHHILFHWRKLFPASLTYVSNFLLEFWYMFNLFFFNFCRTSVSFLMAPDPPVLDFWFRLLWVSKPGWIPSLFASLPACDVFLRFTSGATPADLLVAKPFLFDSRTCKLSHTYTFNVSFSSS